jgi:hypothetical protein
MDLPALPERDDCQADAIPLADLLAGNQPVVLRGVARDWSLVRAGRQGRAEAMALLRRHDDGRPRQYSYGAPAIGGRPFYSDDYRGLNFEVRRDTLDALLQQVDAHAADAQPPTFYLASLPIDDALPGLRADNDLDLAATGIAARPSIWIGNRVTASCHYDALNNIACVAVGRRRFTLFPPAQIGNLYPGPLDPTPGGQAVSTVDFNAPDFDRHPGFRAALAHARSATLEPGDAIFMPAMWWHQVEALDPFNVLVNYWWTSAPAHLAAPMHALYHALWALRDRPQAEKDAWRAVFEHYVFGPAGQAGAHLPEAARQALGPIDPALARQLRALLIGKLNR